MDFANAQVTKFRSGSGKNETSARSLTAFYFLLFLSDDKSMFEKLAVRRFLIALATNTRVATCAFEKSSRN
jgi:hypothetical protein